MTILACGINHKSAPLALRERAVFTLEKLPVYLADLLGVESVEEAVILSTCNRSDIYCATENVEQVIKWFAEQHDLASHELNDALYVYTEEAAITHMMKVACGIDSMVLGESQILGQMKVAFSESCAAGAIGGTFNRLFQHIFSVAKEVRSNTSIGACPVSVASTAVTLAKQLVPDLAKARVAVLGAGTTVELVLRHLHSAQVSDVTIVNRTLPSAEILAAKYGTQVCTLDELKLVLQRVDVVISSTGSAHPLIAPEHISPHHPLILIDIAVPRDVDPRVNACPGVRLYSIDDLRDIIQHNLKGREHAAEKALDVIHQKTVEFVSWQKSLDKIASTIRMYRNQIEEMCRIELAKATKQLERGDDPVQALQCFAHAFTNKLLHTPSVQLRQAGFEGRFDVLQFAQELFAISQSE